MTTVAYLVSDYHAPSHTFVRREVAALGARGMNVSLFSVQSSATDRGKHVESLLGRPLLDYPTSLLWALFSRPVATLSAWFLSVRHRAPGLKALIWSQFHFVEAVVLARLLGKHHIARLHCHFANSGAGVGMIAAHLLDIPWSLTLHGISETDYPAGLLLPEKIERAEFVACASYFMRAQAMRVVDRKHWSKLHIVRCGVDPKALPPKMIGGANAVLRMVSVGRISPEKGYFGLLEALAYLADKGEAFSLTVVGDGPALGALRAQVEELDLADRITFTGALDEPGALSQIATADVFVFPSLMEGLPVVLMEAMALGKAVIASRVAGIPELVEDGVSGLLFTPSDWKELSDRLELVLSDSVKREGLGQAAEKAVEEHFYVSHSAEQLQKLFFP
jgi:glycosyltransferase involved in cell wall biosynthesis